MAPLATLISLAAIALLFAANLHWELLRGLVASYDVMPVGADFNARLALKQIADVLGESFRLALRIASPYVIYALVVNLALALVNRLTPQVQVFLSPRHLSPLAACCCSTSPSNQRSKRSLAASAFG